MKKKFMRWLSETLQSFVVQEVYFILWPLIKGIMEGVAKSAANGTLVLEPARMHKIYSAITEGVAFSDRVWMMLVICIISGWVNTKLRAIPKLFRGKESS